MLSALSLTPNKLGTSTKNEKTDRFEDGITVLALINVKYLEGKQTVRGLKKTKD